MSDVLVNSDLFTVGVLLALVGLLAVLGFAVQRLGASVPSEQVDRLIEYRETVLRELIDMLRTADIIPGTTLDNTIAEWVADELEGDVPPRETVEPTDESVK
jgi:hypothetical protein